MRIDPFLEKSSSGLSVTGFTWQAATGPTATILPEEISLTAIHAFNDDFRRVKPCY
jgi:hypothetical protein